MKYDEICNWMARAQGEGFSIGSFSPRNTMLIPWILDAAQSVRSPVIIQISSNEMRWFELDPKTFSKAFFECAEKISVPVILHLDHTYDMEHIRSAVEAGFQSVMIDGSKYGFEENVRLTKEVVAYAHDRGVVVEAELGNIGGTDQLETEMDTSLYTVPEQAEEFVSRTGCDQLAVSVGTAHGVYLVNNPKIDFDRLTAIRELVSCPLVLHGGSGLPCETVKRAIRLGDRGGISKLNIATDLELIFQRVLKVGRMPSSEWGTLPADGVEQAGREVKEFVMDRMKNYLFSAGKAKW